ncbi:cyclase family protein [Desulfonatronovibrio magnus]|uniref:cyclase family protein n=1 Tax=Desulfonatronovibrio magnus TaxID=698827 RepID=UPI0005EBDCE3|nr:cyclase family protein [Desulfonatronovibrio magnus]
MTAKNCRPSWILLSYPLHPEAPSYGGGSSFKDQEDKLISRGDSCNTRKWYLSNHMGTHIDFPRHFTNTGPALTDFDPGFFISNNIHVVDISPVEPGQIITHNLLEHHNIPDNVEFLFIRTGFSHYRSQDVYWQNNPGFEPDLSDYLREKTPHLRVMGFDSISLSSFSNRNLGRKAHKSFLDNEHFILPLEDMDLSIIDSKCQISSVVIAPLQVFNADGAPCTVFAMIS